MKLDLPSGPSLGGKDKAEGRMRKAASVTKATFPFLFAIYPY